MPTAVTTEPAQQFYEFPFQEVEVSTDPTDSGSWVTSPYLWCRELKLAVNAYDSAILEYEIGNKVLQPGATTFTDYQPLSLRGKYVRIIIAQDAPLDDITWVGYVLTDQVSRDGVETVAGVQKFKGEKQEFACVGLEWFLDRKQVETSRVDADNDDEYVEIQRALKFNGGESSTLDMKAATRGNRSPDSNSDGLYYFSDDPTTEDKWTAADIVAYLLSYQYPVDKDGAQAPCEFVFVDSAVLDGFEPTIVAEHKTVFQLLNAICSPQRGLCWWLEFFDGVGIAQVRVASLSRDALTLPGGGTFPENANPITLSFDGELDVKNVLVINQGKRNYHRVTCRGARQTCTFTIGVHDETLKTDWTDEQEIDYKGAALLDSDYSALTPVKQKDRNDAYRLNDRVARVFSYYRIPKDWDGKTGDGWEKSKQFAIAEISDTGSRIGGLPLNTQGIRLLNRTRLKNSVDYSDPTAPVSDAPEGSLEEFLAPFAFVRVEYDKSSPSDLTDDLNRWQYVEKLNEAKFHAGTAITPHIHTQYRPQMQSAVPGIIVAAHGSPSHTLAKDHFDDTDTGDAEPSKFKPEVSYDDLRATVCAEADFYASSSAEVVPLPSGVPIEELIVDLGDDYRLDYLAENTVVEIKSGLCVTAPTFAILRDDREHLRDLANIALQWYREDRQQLTVEFRQLRNLFSLGQLVTTIGEGTTQSTINTVISVLTYDFKTGTMALATVDSALDLRMVSGEARRRGKA